MAERAGAERTATGTPPVDGRPAWAQSQRPEDLLDHRGLRDEGEGIDNNRKTPASSKASAETHHAVAKMKRVVFDSLITTQVKSEILAHSVSKGFEVSVEAIHGVVALKVPWQTKMPSIT